jgi:hypothetical protein
MSTSVLPQLLQVDSELSTQEIALEAELKELQEKRRGIQTVIAMFESGNALEISKIASVSAALAPVEIPVETAIKTPKARSASGKATKRASAKTPAKTAAKTPVKAKAAKTPAKAPAKVKTAKTETAKPGPKPGAKSALKSKLKVAKATKVKATRGRPAKTLATAAVGAKDSAAKRSSGRAANWQRYIQENYSTAPLPDVIVGVLQAQPNTVFKIADVMNAVFKEDMPKSHFLKARNRVSNILSAGARDGDWYRGRGGTYSVSEKAVKAAG